MHHFVQRLGTKPGRYDVRVDRAVAGFSDDDACVFGVAERTAFKRMCASFMREPYPLEPFEVLVFGFPNFSLKAFIWSVIALSLSWLIVLPRALVCLALGTGWCG